MQEQTPVDQLIADLKASGYTTSKSENWNGGTPGQYILHIEQGHYYFAPITDGSFESIERIRTEILRRNWPWTPRQASCLDCGAEAEMHPFVDTDRANGPICRNLL